MHLSQKELFLNHQAQTTHFPLLLEMKRAEGCYIYDQKDKPYLDLISGIGVSSLGHGNQKVKDAIIAQVNQHMHLMVYGEMVMQPQTELAALLVSILPENLNCVYFVNSGSEATEGALKLAKRITNRHKIIAFKQAYHGSTHAALSLNSEEYFKSGYRPLLPGITFLEYNSIEDLTAIDAETACVIVETVRGESGYITPEPGFLSTLREVCSRTGTMLIFDEIQCGMGRTGEMFAFHHEKVIPDILLLGKALGGGMPIGAFISSKEYMSVLADNPILGHITTFGGHPVCCAAAVASLREILSQSWVEEVSEKEALFRKLLVHPLIKSITGKGLMLALEFESFAQNKAIIDGCLQDGLITDWFLFATHKMRIAPPLVIENWQIINSCEIILKNCDKFVKQLK